MKNVPHKKGCHTGAVEIHVELPPITLIKINNDTKADKDFVKKIA